MRGRSIPQVNLFVNINLEDFVPPERMHKALEFMSLYAVHNQHAA